MITLLIIIAKLNGGNFQQAFQLNNFDRRYILLIITSLACTVVTSILINYFFSSNIYTNKSFDLISNNNFRKYSIWYFSLSVIIIPLFEELIFRSVLFKSFTKRYGRNIAIVLTTILFGLIHLEPNKICYTLVLGLFACFITIETKSLYPAIILHVMYNAYAYFCGIRISQLLPTKIDPIVIISLGVLAILFLIGTIQIKRKINLTTAST